MKDKILEIINTKPKHYSIIIKKDNELYKWVMDNTILAYDRPLVEHIRSAVYNETNICENNKTKKFKDIKDGFIFCGRANICECCKKSVSQNVIKTAATKTKEEIAEISEKRKNTNIEKYGVDNIGKIDKAIENHKKFYNDTEMVNSALTKMKATHLKRYGVENPQHNKEIQEKTKKTNLERYGVENPQHNKEIQEKTKKTNLERYGVENPSMHPEIRDKIKKILSSEEVREKTIQTNLERYGAEYFLSTNEFREKVKQTNLERYGVENPSMHPEIRDKISKTLMLPEIKEKIKKTNLERYGAENPFMSPKIQEKVRQTNLEKYGYLRPSQSHLSHEAIEIINNKEKFSDFIKDRSAYEVSKELGIHQNSFYKIVNRYGFQDLYQKRGPSYLEVEMAEFLNKLGIQYETNNRTILNGKELDFYIPEKNIAIEMNGIYWHNDFKNPDKMYHYDKWKKCIEKDIQLISIFEDDWIYKNDNIKNIVKTHLGLVSFEIMNEPVIKKIDRSLAKSFLDKHDLYGFCDGIHFGVYNKDELNSVITFKHIFDKVYELCRFTTHNVNVFSKLFTYAHNELNFNEVICFTDNAHFDSNFYKTHNFNLISIIDPDYRYFINGMRISKNDIDIENTIDDLPRVYDCGKCKWIWTL